MSDTATNTDSVEDLVNILCFLDATFTGPDPNVITAPLCPFISGCTATLASTCPMTLSPSSARSITLRSGVMLIYLRTLSSLSESWVTRVLRYETATVYLVSSAKPCIVAWPLLSGVSSQPHPTTFPSLRRFQTSPPSLGSPSCL